MNIKKSFNNPYVRSSLMFAAVFGVILAAADSSFAASGTGLDSAFEQVTEGANDIKDLLTGPFATALVGLSLALAFLNLIWWHVDWKKMALPIIGCFGLGIAPQIAEWAMQLAK